MTFDSGVRSSDEALDELRRSLSDIERAALAAAASAMAVVAENVGQAREELGRRERRRAAIEQALANCRDGEAAARLQAQLREATMLVERAQRAVVQLETILSVLRGSQRRATEDLNSTVPKGRATVGRLLQANAQYRGVARASAIGGMSAKGGSGGSRPPRSSDQPARIGDRGHVLVEVSRLDFSDNPINPADSLFTVGSRHGLSLADYHWAMDTWADVVGPGVAAGKTRDDFEYQDMSTGAAPERRQAGVYDMFLGGEEIVVGRLPDGTFDVTNGRHRIELARRHGITHLPIRIIGE